MSNVCYWGLRAPDRTVVVMRSDGPDDPMSADAAWTTVRPMCRFGWGALSPAALELAEYILVDVVDDVAMADLYATDFAFEVVSKLEDDAWYLDAGRVREWFVGRVMVAAMEAMSRYGRGGDCCG